MGTIRETTNKDGSKSYHAEVRLKGANPQRRACRTRTAAKKWIQDTESAIRDGRFKNQSQSRKYTVGDMIDRFIANCVPKHPIYHPKKVQLLMRWKKELGKLLLAELSSSHIARVRDKLLNEPTRKKSPRNPATVNRYLSAFSKVISIAIKEWEWLTENPVTKISKPKESNGRTRFLSPEEKSRLLKSCKASSNKDLYSIVALALLTAMRYGEIMQLHWDDIDFIQSKITIQRSKNGDRRILPLTEVTSKLLQQCSSYGQPQDTLIFKSPRRSSSKGTYSIRKSFLKVLNVANIKEFKFHDLRHTAASYMAMNGATQGELMAILGHRSPQMTYRYAHYAEQHLKGQLEKSDKNLLI